MPWTRALVGLVAVAIFAPAAKADTYCVPSCAGGTPEPTVQAALTAAETHSGGDLVQIGAGTFNSASGFHYNSTDPVTIVGAGTGATTLSDSGAPNGTDTLNIAGSTVSTVSGLKLVVYGTGTPFGSALNTVGSADDIVVAGGPGSANIIGITAGAASVISHASVAVPLNGGSGFNEGVFPVAGAVV